MKLRTVVWVLLPWFHLHCTFSSGQNNIKTIVIANYSKVRLQTKGIKEISVCQVPKYQNYRQK